MFVTVIFASSARAQSAPSDGWLPASYDKLPYWRGFNLPNRLIKGTSLDTPFEESDFQMIHELGFNFVRIPMDYRNWIVNGDASKINEEFFKELDQVVAWGEKYRIHVSFCIHSAPGFTVYKRPHTLWDNPETQRICAMHWAYFAKRYKGIPNTRLSFNLFNEPNGTSTEVYINVVKKMAEAIRQIDPDRLIIADGFEWAHDPVPELVPLKVAQAGRCYVPHSITHYNASWIKGSNFWTEPLWPVPLVSSVLYGPRNPLQKGPLQLSGAFPAGARLTAAVATGSSHGKFVIAADGDTIVEEEFANPGAMSKEAQGIHVVYDPKLRKEITAVLPKAAKVITLECASGSLTKLISLSLQPVADGRTYGLPLVLDYGFSMKPNQVLFQPEQSGKPWVAAFEEDGDFIWRTEVAKWVQLRDQNGIGVMLGEFGCYNTAPHDVTLRWMEDVLKNCRKGNVGWALWMFRGDFGVLDSKRKDVTYEDYQGHKLDRKMLEILQRY